MDEQLPRRRLPTNVTHVTVLPWGDSITGGYTTPPGYRRTLWSTALGGGYVVDYLGSQADAGGWAERHHQGVSGDKVADARADADAGLLATYPADVILLMLGSNDLWNAGAKDGDPAATLTAISNLLDVAYTALPSVRVVWMALPPSSDATMNGLVSTFNSGMATKISTHTAQGRKVVAGATGLTTGDMLDEVHPNSATGYPLLAAGFWSGFTAVMAL
jgi:lysophospholipase L1-like esterase